MNDNSLRGYKGANAPHLPIATDSADSLERSCKVGVTRDRLQWLGGISGVEHIEASFTGDGFSPHRHDTYGIGVTLAGVQTFQYRGSRRASLPGNVIVLHPDELHDGAAGTDSGLVYRMIYIAPERIVDALGERGALPFVADPVVTDLTFRDRIGSALLQLDDTPSDLAVDALVTVIADGLQRHCDDPLSSTENRVGTAIAAVRDHLAANCDRDVRSEELEAIAGIDRYSVARQFRRAFGTSPHRYLVMRRLDLARSLLRHGSTLVEAASMSGFADQAHFTRHFRQTYGMTPGRWLALTTD